MRRKRGEDTMNEQTFEELAESTSEKARSIKCSAEDYRQGLRIIIDLLEADARASHETNPS